MNMSSKNQLVRAQLTRYFKTNKEEKTNILDELCAATGYHRKYALAKLKDFQRHSPGERELRRHKPRPRIYGADCLPPLKKIWEFLDWPCGERLRPFLPEIIPKLEAVDELKVAPSVRAKLLTMSISTVDRLLREQRRIRRRKIQATTKPGTLLKHQIPVRLELWPEETVPGFTELDLVAHCGPTNAGEYVLTLSVVDIATTWIEHGAVLGRGQQRIRAALDEIESRLPFRLRGIDPDNDSGFINYNLKSWCDGHTPPVSFTRSRPYRKNDNAHVEQKNWSTVRQVLGYLRIETEEQRQLMAQLYAGPLRDWQNFFQPTLKLREKKRIGARVIRRHDEALTPYRRVMKSRKVSPRKKAELKKYYDRLNPVVVKREMIRLVNEIFNLNRRSAGGGKKSGKKQQLR